MLKQITKYILAITLLSTFAVADSVLARNANDSPNNIPTFQVAKDTVKDWRNSMSFDVDNTNTISFQVHYYGWHEGAQNIVTKADNLNNKIFEANQWYTVNGWADADNLSKASGSVKIKFNHKVKLKKYFTSDRKNDCQSTACQDSSASGFLGSGAHVGSLPVKDNSNYYGNTIVVYIVEKVNTPTPVNGSCGSSVDTCSAGTFHDLADSNTQYKWECQGSNGGQAAQCSKDKPQGQDCSVNGVTVRDGHSLRFYSRTHVDADDSCSNYDQTRTCNNGTMSGSSTFRYDSCSRDQDEDLEVRTYSPRNIGENRAQLRGRIYNEDADDIWFAFSGTDSTPSCTSHNQIIAADGDNDEGSIFYKNIDSSDGLACGETYYFRACADDSNGNISRGSVRSFRTDRCQSREEAVVYTNSATNIYTTSAQLNGRIVVNDTENAKVYFVFGTSASNMNRRTSYLGVSRDSVFQAITGLNSGTRYYFQAIVRDNNGIVDRGIIRSFVTKSTNRVAVTGRCGSRTNTCTRGYLVNTRDTNSYIKWNCVGYNGGRTAACSLKKYVRPVQPVIEPKPIEVTVNETTIVNEVKSEKYYEERGLEITKYVGRTRTGVFGISTTAKSGDTVFYKIKVKNTSNDVVDVKVEDFLPEELNDKDGTTADSDRYMTWVLKMNPGESKVFLKELVVDKDVIKGEIIDSAAKITIDDKTEDTNNVEITIVGDNFGTGNENSASIFGANSSFFPTSIVGWLAVLLLGLGVLFLGTKVFTTVATKKD